MFEPEQPFLEAFFEPKEKAAYAQFRVAHCGETDRDLLLSCVLLEYRDADDETIHEFQFEFRVVSNDETQESFSTMDRQIVAEYLPQQIRPQIMNLVLDGLDALLLLVRPKRIFRVTKEREPHEKSLLKHHRVSKKLEQAGYSIYEEGIDEFGRNYWDMLAS
jgi:hypothetical protein